VKHAHMLYEMVRADFLERVRRYSFLLTLAGALYLGYSVATERMWVVVGDGYRGVYNSAWIGAVMAVCSSAFLSLIGFYVVKNSVARDSETRVGQILAATPMRKSFYAVAKMASNFAVLTSMVLVLMVAAAVMQLVRSEVHGISLWKLWAPFLLIALPSMAITAAIAVLFEMLPVLNGGVGNIAYFFLWGTGLALGVQEQTIDPTGIQLLFNSTRAALLKIDPSQPKRFSVTVGGEHATRTFLWNGFDWTTQIVLVRLAWILVAIGIALLASIFFHRFDPARGFWRRKIKAETPVRNGEAVAATQTRSSTPAAQLTPLAGVQGKFRFFGVVIAELRLMLKGQRWWWYGGAAVIVIGSLASPVEYSRGAWLIAAWIWPVLLWSQMGTREATYNTSALIFSSQGALQRQMPALWAAGALVTWLIGAGAGVRILLAGDSHALLAWVVGGVFIPSLALAFGVWSGRSKAFEAVYTAWWYVGPLHHVRGMDFAGTTANSATPAAYLLAGAALLLTAYAGRRARIVTS
jgi:hypothetical protein